MDDHEHLEIIAPFLPHDVLVELCSGRHHEQYKRARIERAKLEARRAIWEQEQMGKLQAQQEKRVVKVNGIEVRHTAEIHPMLRASMVKQYGHECWNDKEFFNDMLKRNPAMKVPDPPKKTWLVQGLKNEDSQIPGSS